MEWESWSEPAGYRGCPSGTWLYLRNSGSWAIAQHLHEFRLVHSDTYTKWAEMQVLDVHTFKEACALAEVILRMKGELSA